MSPRALALAAGIACLAIGAAWLALILPAQHRASSSGGEVDRLRSELAAKAQLPAGAPHPVSSGSPKVHAALRRAIPEQPMGGGVIGDLARAAAEAGLDLSSVNLGAAGASGGSSPIRAIPVRLTVSGDYREIVTFLDRLDALVRRGDRRIEADGRLISIDSVAIDARSAKQSAGEMLTSQMRGSAFTMPAGRRGP